MSCRRGTPFLKLERDLSLQSVGVTCNALSIRSLRAPDVSDASVFIAALLHHLGKAGCPSLTWKVDSEATTMNPAARGLHPISD